MQRVYELIAHGLLFAYYQWLLCQFTSSSLQVCHAYVINVKCSLKFREPLAGYNFKHKFNKFQSNNLTIKHCDRTKVKTITVRKL